MISLKLVKLLVITFFLERDEAVTSSVMQSITPASVDCTKKLKVGINIGTDQYPLRTSWNLTNLKTSKQVWSSSAVQPYSTPWFNYYNTNCFENGTYKFAIYNSDGEGLWEESFYILYVNDKLAKKTLGPRYYYLQYEIFGICSSNDDCDDNDTCTVDECVSGQCSFVVAECSQCGKTKVEIKFRNDIYPEDKSWEIIDGKTKEELWSGSYYDNTTSDAIYNHVKCLSDGAYSLRFFNHYASGLYEDDYYNLLVNDVLLQNITGPLTYLMHETKFDICSSDEDCFLDRDICTRTYCNNVTRQCVLTPTFHSTCGAFGNKTLLALRIVTLDAETTESLSQLSNYIFGTDGKNFTMKSQFSACSYDSFNIIPYSGQTMTGQSISDGVGEVLLSMNSTGKHASNIADASVVAANELYGDLIGQFDFVMICLPPRTEIGGTSEW